MFLVKSLCRGGASDNGYKAYHNRTPLNSICRIGNKPRLVYLGSGTRAHSDRIEREQHEACFLRGSFVHNEISSRENLKERNGKKILSSKRNDNRLETLVEIGRPIRQRDVLERRTLATRASSRDKVSVRGRDFTELVEIDSWLSYRC